MEDCRALGVQGFGGLGRLGFRGLWLRVKGIESYQEFRGFGFRIKGVESYQKNSGV